MKKFNNKSYETLVNDLIGDTFYCGISYRGRVAKIRQYTEVIVRKLIDYDPDKCITLGKHCIEKRIHSIPNYCFIKDSLENIRNYGNDDSHTQKRDVVTEDEYNRVVDSLFNMLSILLINYFDKYKFGSNEEVMFSFSLLPPIIRYKVLSYLYEKDSENISIIDKLVLSIMKAYDIDTAKKWIEKEKENLILKKAITENAYNDLIEKKGIVYASYIYENIILNMYESCKQKILTLEKNNMEKNKLYLDFESALPYYKENGVLSKGDEESNEFNDIMYFLYMGRKEQIKKELSFNVLDSYVEDDE